MFMVNLCLFLFMMNLSVFFMLLSFFVMNLLLLVNRFRVYYVMRLRMMNFLMRRRVA